MTPELADDAPGWRGLVAPTRRQNLAHDVYDTLKALIMDQSIAAGSRINLDEAARRLGVSQSPLREALARLESEGLVTKEAFRGWSTTPLLTSAEFEDLFEFRLLIEPWSAARAARLGSDAGRARLRAELASCPALPTGTDYLRSHEVAGHDARLHELVHEIGGNQQLRLAFQRTHCHLHTHRLYYDDRMMYAAAAEHGAVVDAITRGDAEAASSAMRTHLEAARTRLRPAFERTTRPT